MPTQMPTAVPTPSPTPTPTPPPTQQGSGGRRRLLQFVDDADFLSTVGPLTPARREDKFRIQVDRRINWDASTLEDPDGDGRQRTGYVQIVKFTPASTGNYEYVSECAGRGLCNRGEGLCECFSGYTGDNCEEQSVLR